MWNDFKKFAIKGHVLDLAIGVIIGSAFGKIVSSLVNDLLMPLLGLLGGGLNVSNLSVTIGDSIIKYGSFLQSIIDFLIVSFSIFLFVKVLTRLKLNDELLGEKDIKPVTASESEEIKLLREIRDSLKKD